MTSFEFSSLSGERTNHWKTVSGLRTGDGKDERFVTKFLYC
jgi:hypothetical protein